MSEIKLTPRLQCIAAQVAPHAALADVGCDHAHLPLYLLQRGIVRGAVASDVREGPLAHARANAEACGLQDLLSLRLAAGLDGVSPTECDTVSIAGMGGETIAAILAAAPWTRTGAHRLLLQPMTRAAELRQFLLANGYAISEEHVCREERRLYVVLCAVGGAPCKTAALSDCLLSPALLRDPMAKDYIAALLHREARVLQGMERGAAAARAAQADIVQNLRATLEELS